MYKQYKEYRIDTFGKEHNSTFFDTKQDALDFAKSEVEKGKITFLLEHVIDGVYDVMEEIR